MCISNELAFGQDGSLCWGELDDSGFSVFGAIFVQVTRHPPHPIPIIWPLTLQPNCILFLSYLVPCDVPTGSGL